MTRAEILSERLLLYRQLPDLLDQLCLLSLPFVIALGCIGLGGQIAGSDW
jgi:hypothetical protein